MKKERLTEVKELDNYCNVLDNWKPGDVALNAEWVKLDNTVCELAAKYAYEDMIAEYEIEIEEGEHLVMLQVLQLEKDEDNEGGINYWFDDLYDDYYNEIYEVHGTLVLYTLEHYEQKREGHLQHYQQLYSDTYLKNGDLED